jgi:hypothetical protein
MDKPLFQTERVASPEVEKEVREMMTYAPWGEKQKAAGKEVVESLTNSILVIIKNVPPGDDRDVAIRKIREARMDANSALTHQGRF